MPLEHGTHLLYGLHLHLNIVYTIVGELLNLYDALFQLAQNAKYAQTLLRASPGHANNSHKILCHQMQ